jgi:hypothetical protein
MKWTTLSGKVRNFNPMKYKIKWEEDGRSKPETKVRNFLRPFWKNDVVLAEMLYPSTRFRADLVNLSKKIILEVSPASVHLQYNEFMHGSRSGFLKKLKADNDKMLIAEKNGFKHIELHDEEINNLSKEMFKEKFDVNL